MPSHKACKKSIITSTKANERNRQIKSKIKTVIKNIRNAKDKDIAKDALKTAYKILDKAAKTNVIHKNKAANQKSQLSIYANKLSA